MELTHRFEEALQYALDVHRNQLRKGSETPYISHLLAVAALVLEDGGDEDQAIAALLHDAPEDQGGLQVLEEIRQRFGERVAGIVHGCTDTYQSPKPPWRERKEAYLEHLIHASPEVRRVSLADKLHNARSILTDLLRSGDAVWERFNGGREGTFWYYRRLLEIFRNVDESPLVVELGWVMERIEKVAARFDHEI
ncbi:MAG: HD domain-containing protein [Anaerolineales bacterium]|nr:HD domain-containing protein [Anaerolineales bacterium]